MSEKHETDVSKRVIFIRAQRQMSDEEVSAALGSMAENDPRWQAVNQLLDMALALAVYDVSSPTQNTGAGTYAGGQVAALAELKAELHARRMKLVGGGAGVAPAAKPRAARA